MERLRGDTFAAVLVCFGIALALLVACGRGSAAAHLRDGDLIFQTSRSSQSLAIQRATESPYSHMGMIVHRDKRPFVFEAIATVRYTPFDEWIARGEGGRYVVKRVRDASSRLTPATMLKAKALLRKFQGKPYDLPFDWSDERMYCSELVWKIYDQAAGIQIGALQQMREFKLEDRAVQTKLRERYGAKVPLDAPVISPAAMFGSALLEVVVER